MQQESYECSLHVVGVDASPLMTWGSIDGTPLRLDSDSVTPTGPSFKMPKVPAREMVALKLADQVAKANREKRKKSTSVTRYERETQSILIGIHSMPYAVLYCGRGWGLLLQNLTGYVSSHQLQES